MIVQRQTNIQLRKTYTRILYLCEAVNETFVFIGLKGLMKDCIVHVNKYGQQLFCHHFDRPIDSMIMITEYQAAVLETRANVITILDLNKHQFKRIPHLFNNEQSDQSLFWTFPETKYMAVIEKGRYNDNRIKITYYNFPQTNPNKINGESLMYHRKELLENEFKGDDGIWNLQYKIVKGNNHSMVLWYKERQDKCFQFRFYRRNKYMRLGDAKSNSSPSPWEFKIVNIDHQLQSLYKMPKLQIAVLQAFQLEQDRLLINCWTNREYVIKKRKKIEKQKYLDEDNWLSLRTEMMKKLEARRQKQENQEWKGHENEVSSLYIVDLNLRKVEQTRHDLGKYQPFMIDHMLFGSCHMIRTFGFIKDQVLVTPVIYFSNTTLKPVVQQTWKCTYKTKYFFPGYDAYTMIENEYENGNVTEFKCKYKKLIEYKQMLVFFMLELNEDFDDDLVQDVVEMICDQ